MCQNQFKIEKNFTIQNVQRNYLQNNEENCVSNDVEYIDQYQLCNMSSNVSDSIANVMYIDASITFLD